MTSSDDPRARDAADGSWAYPPGPDAPPEAAYPNGASPNGASPNGAHPNDAHPNDAHPNAAYPNAAYSPDGSRPQGVAPPPATPVSGTWGPPSGWGHSQPSIPPWDSGRHSPGLHGSPGTAPAVPGHGPARGARERRGTGTGWRSPMVVGTAAVAVVLAGGIGWAVTRNGSTSAAVTTSPPAPTTARRAPAVAPTAEPRNGDVPSTGELLSPPDRSGAGGGASGSRGPAPTSVRLELFGTGTVAFGNYTKPGSKARALTDTAELPPDTPLPWSSTINNPGLTYFSVVGNTAPGSRGGAIGCRITADGKVVVEKPPTPYLVMCYWNSQAGRR